MLSSVELKTFEGEGEMVDEKIRRARVLSEELHQRETFERLIAQAKVEGLNLDALNDDYSMVGALTQLVRSRGNALLAERFQTAHEMFAAADDLRCGTAKEWDADSASADKQQRATAAKEAADHALHQLEEVIADVRLFLEKGGSH